MGHSRTWLGTVPGVALAVLVLSMGCRDFVGHGSAARISHNLTTDAELYLAKLSPGQAVSHSLRPQRHAWVHVAEGEVTLNGQELKAGDGAAVSEEGLLELGAKAPSQVLLFDLN